MAECKETIEQKSTTDQKEGASDLAKLKADFKKQEKTAFITGYTGDIGSLLLDRLVEENIFSKIVLIGRRKVEFKDEKLASLDQRVVDFNALDEHAEAFAGCHVAYNCLGMYVGPVGALTKSTSDLKKKVDRDYAVNSARLAKQHGCEQFHFVSGMGIDPNSSNKFLKNKGIAEDEIKELGFDRYVIYRPAAIEMVNGPRTFSKRRLAVLMKPLNLLAPDKFFIKSSTLVEAMIYKTVTPSTGAQATWQCLENRDICELVKNM